MNFKDFKLIFRIIILLGISYFYIESDKSDFFFITYILINLIFSLTQSLAKKEYEKYILKIIIFINIIYIFIGFKIAVIFLTQIIIEESIKSNIRLLGVIIFIIIYSFTFNSENYIWFYLYLMIISIFLYLIVNRIFFRSNVLEAKLDEERKYINKIKLKMENEAEYYKNSIAYAKLEERNKISRRMHDEVGHIIAASILRLEAATIVLDSDLEKGKEMVGEITEHLRKGMNDIRNTIHEITPESEEIGLNRLKTLIENKFKNSNIIAKIRCSGDIEKINSKQWIIINESIKELSTNTLKYSNCERVYIIIDVLNKLIKVNFKDDGIGKEKIVKGYGLKKIEESLIENNGDLILNGKDGFSAILLLKID